MVIQFEIKMLLRNWKHENQIVANGVHEGNKLAYLAYIKMTNEKKRPNIRQYLHKGI